MCNNQFTNPIIFIPVGIKSEHSFSGIIGLFIAVITMICGHCTRCDPMPISTFPDPLEALAALVTLLKWNTGGYYNEDQDTTAL